MESLFAAEKGLNAGVLCFSEERGILKRKFFSDTACQQLGLIVAFDEILSVPVRRNRCDYDLLMMDEFL